MVCTSFRDIEGMNKKEAMRPEALAIQGSKLGLWWEEFIDMGGVVNLTTIRQVRLSIMCECFYFWWP